MIVVIGLPAYAGSPDGEGSARRAGRRRGRCRGRPGRVRGAGRQGWRRRCGRRGRRWRRSGRLRHRYPRRRSPPWPSTRQTRPLAGGPACLPVTVSGPTAGGRGRRRVAAGRGRAATRRSGRAAGARGRGHRAGVAIPGRDAGRGARRATPRRGGRGRVEGATFAGARLVVLLPPGATPPALPPEATLLEAPAVDDGSFGRLVGAFAGGLDAGSEPAVAFAEAVTASGWEPVID